MKTIVSQHKVRLERHITKAAGGAGNLFRSRYGLWLLAMISFVESALVVPIITDPFLVAYILVNRSKALRALFITTIASVLGGAVAYATAALVIELFLRYFISSLSAAELHEMAQHFEGGTFLITILGAITPIPYTVVALAAGSVQANFFIFIIASFIGRGMRYALVTYLTFKFGERAVSEVQKRIWPSTIAALVLIALYLWYKLS